MAWPAETLDHWPSDGRGTGYLKVFIECCKSDVKVLLMYREVVAQTRLMACIFVPWSDLVRVIMQ